MRVILLIVFCAIAGAPASQNVTPVRFVLPDPKLDLINKTSLIESRIINGNEAPRNDFPYMAGMEIRVDGGYTWCGGAIISQSYVLTAAHCIDTAYWVTLYLGAHDRTSRYETPQVRIYVGASFFTIHKDWSTKNLRNDIALIRIPEKIQYTKAIQAIAIPTRAMQENTFEGNPAVVTGWGYTAGTTKLAQYLQYADIMILKQEKCIAFLKPWINPTNICVDGSTGAGGCYGDSGSPLVTNTGLRYVIGVASFVGFEGCEANWPTVYTRVTSYIDWISSITGLRIE